MSGVTVWQWQMVYIAHGVTGQLEGPLAEFCLGPQGGQDRHWQPDSVTVCNKLQQSLSGFELEADGRGDLLFTEKLL